MRVDLLVDDNVWAAMVAAKFAQHPAIDLPPGNLWEPGIARSLVKAVKEGRHGRDGIEMLMALQLGIAEQRTSNPTPRSAKEGEEMSRLGDGTQELLLHDAVKAVCRCGRQLAWKFLVDHAQLSAEADCECGMSYTAWQPVITVKIEGRHGE